MILGVFAALISCVCAALSVALWFCLGKNRELDRTIQELSNTVSALRYSESTDDRWSEGYNKGREDAEKLYKGNLHFMQEHYGSLISQFENYRVRANQIQLEDSSPIAVIKRELEAPPTKVFQVSPALDTGVGTQDISQQLGAFS